MTGASTSCAVERRTSSDERLDRALLGVHTHHMTTRTAPQLTINHVEAENRAAKAARLAKTAIEGGVTPDMLDRPAMRAMILSATPRTTPTRRGEKVWTEASEQTWVEVKAIFLVFAPAL